VKRLLHGIERAGRASLRRLLPNAPHARVYVSRPSRIDSWRIPLKHGTLELVTADAVDSLPAIIDGAPVTWMAQPVPESLRHVNQYALARRAADAAVDLLREVDERLFARLVDGVDLQTTYATRLLYKLATSGMSSRLSFAALHECEETPRIVLDSLVPRRGLTAMAAHASIDASGIAAVQHASSLRDRALHATLNARTPPSTVAPSSSSEVRHGVLFVIGTRRDIELLAPMAGAIPADQPITLLLKREVSRAADHWAQATGRAPAACGQLADLIDAQHLAAQMQSINHHLTQWLKNVAQVSDANDRAVLREHVAELKSLAAWAAQVRQFMALLQPRSVIGAFEKSPYGCLLSELRTSHDFRCINVQHGNIPLASALDRMMFDHFLVWDSISHQIVRDDGYAASNPVTIVGNPRWGALRRDVNRPAASDIGRQLEQWKANRTVIALCTQPPQKALVSSAAWSRLIDAVCTLVRPRQNLAILLRPHEMDRRAIDHALFNELQRDGRACVQPPSACALADALRIADVVVSMYSTVLVDAARCGIPALGADVTNVRSSIGLRMPEDVRMVDSIEALIDALHEVTDGSSSRSEPSAEPDICPDAATFTRRAREVLQASLHCCSG
jgi:hypothetical protein